MIELVFHEDLYSGTAIDRAAKVFAEHAGFELERRDGAFVVRVTSKGGHDERTIALELANYALGATIEQRGARP